LTFRTNVDVLAISGILRSGSHNVPTDPDSAARPHDLLDALTGQTRTRMLTTQG
jgi:hypothetical protein